MNRETHCSRKIELEGHVVSGLGVGAKYVEMYREQFRKYLGIDPYPGTLNVDVGVNALEMLASIPAIIIPPPRKGLAIVVAYKGYIDGEEVYVLKPCITEHGWHILEIVSPYNLREKLGLKDGSKIKITVIDPLY